MFQDPFFSDAPDHVRSFGHDFSFPSMSYAPPTRPARELIPASDSNFSGHFRDRALQPHHGTTDPCPRRDLVPFGLGIDHDFGDPFGGIERMMTHMRSTFDNLHRNMEMMHRDVEFGRPDGHSFIRQSVYSYSSTGNGAPRVYEAHSSTRTAPGGIRETRKAVRDSERELEKMAIGHHIEERGHVMERSRNTRTNDRQEHNYFEHIGETDESHRAFDDEWVKRTRDLMGESERALPATTAGRTPFASSSPYSRNAAAAAAASHERHRESLSRGFSEGYGASGFPSYAAHCTNGGGEGTESFAKPPSLDYHHH